MDKTQVLNEINNRFSKNDLDTVAFDMGWDADDFAKTKRAMALQMLQKAQRWSQLNRFYQVLSSRNGAIQFDGNDLTVLENIDTPKENAPSAQDPSTEIKERLIAGLANMEKKALFDAMIFLVERA